MSPHPGAFIVLLFTAGLGCVRRAATDMEPRGTCYAVAYSDWQPGGEGRTFYEPLPAHIELTTRRDTEQRDSSARVG